MLIIVQTNNSAFKNVKKEIILYEIGLDYFSVFCQLQKIRVFSTSTVAKQLGKVIVRKFISKVNTVKTRYFLFDNHSKVIVGKSYFRPAVLLSIYFIGQKYVFFFRR